MSKKSEIRRPLRAEIEDVKHTFRAPQPKGAKGVNIIGKKTEMIKKGKKEPKMKWEK